MKQNFEQEQKLNAVAITDGELREILSRLAIEESSNLAGQSTLRDVAELTEVPVNTIARILADIREEDEIARLAQRMDKHDSRLNLHEEKIAELQNRGGGVWNPPVPPSDPKFKRAFTSREPEFPERNRELNDILARHEQDQAQPTVTMAAKEKSLYDIDKVETQYRARVILATIVFVILIAAIVTFGAFLVTPPAPPPPVPFP